MAKNKSLFAFKHSNIGSVWIQEDYDLLQDQWKTKNFMAQIKSIYKFLKGKKILITTLVLKELALWLIKIGCSVVGISKSVEKNQSNFYNFKFQKK